MDYPINSVNRKIDKVKTHPITGHEDPECSRGIAVFFL